ncbi:hypothetical protein SAY86_028487 [Trapa natans]|uniref:Vacuolar ATPase assembly protein VMA22 n=1 Tax=Trapa natans TaxID=22666 RepID=A0AAN7MID0_TRANT|nr:hypothetical protein SAY86_028487 [Trapa natans]
MAEGAGGAAANGGSDEKVLDFLDSVDSYLTTMESLAPILRQGWFDLASARHSMGVFRVSSASLDLKDHSASTYLQMVGHESDDSFVGQPSFSLCKWASADNKSCCSEEEIPDSQLRHRGTSRLSENQEQNSNGDDSLKTVDDLVKKERAKTLSVFGTLVSPKLRTAQLSFETALEVLVEAANIRSSMLSAYSQVQKQMEDTREGEIGPIP